MLWLMNLGFAAGGTVTPPAPVAPTAQTPAGSRRRKYFVEIDGQQFPVDSAAQAVELLLRARAIAEAQAEKKANRATKVLKRRAVVPKVRIAPPVIVAPADLRADLAPLIADIERLYRQAAETAELRLLLLKQIEADEDEEDVLLLL